MLLKEKKFHRIAIISKLKTIFATLINMLYNEKDFCTQNNNRRKRR